jgi:hypothetical protein
MSPAVRRRAREISLLFTMDTMGAAPYQPSTTGAVAALRPSMNMDVRFRSRRQHPQHGHDTNDNKPKKNLEDGISF